MFSPSSYSLASSVYSRFFKVIFAKADLRLVSSRDGLELAAQVSFAGYGGLIGAFLLLFLAGARSSDMSSSAAECFSYPVCLLLLLGSVESRSSRDPP